MFVDSLRGLVLSRGRRLEPSMVNLVKVLCVSYHGLFVVKSTTELSFKYDGVTRYYHGKNIPGMTIVKNVSRLAPQVTRASIISIISIGF